MAKFKPGQSGNPAGRPRKPSKSNTEIRQLIRDFLSGHLDYEDLCSDFEELKAGERFKIRLDLMGKIVPAPIDLNRLSPEELSELAAEIKKQLQDEKNITGLN